MITWELKNGEGNLQKGCFREYREGDEEGIISCIRDEYGDTYFKRNFYDKAYLQKEAASGHITFLIAQVQAEESAAGQTSDTAMGQTGNTAGMLILKQFYPAETMCEIASLIIKKQYRGYGIAELFLKYGMEILQKRMYSAALCLPVLFHDITQRLLYRQGLRATGFLLNVFDLAQIEHSYRNGRNTKHSQGIQIKAAGKKDVGVLYFPPEHEDFCREIYDSLDVSYEICRKHRENGEKRNGGVTGQSVLSCLQDKCQKSLEIRIQNVGADLRRQLRQIQCKYPLVGRQTANVLLNCNDSNCNWAYGILKHMGYFFTGLRPLCGEREYLVLHHPGQTQIAFEDYAVSDEFARLLAYVQKNIPFES